MSTSRIEAELEQAKFEWKYWERVAGRALGELYRVRTEKDAQIAALKQQLAAAQDDTPPLYRCTACEAESEGDPPDCPRDGVHCNVVEVG